MLNVELLCQGTMDINRTPADNDKDNQGKQVCKRMSPSIDTESETPSLENKKGENNE